MSKYSNLTSKTTNLKKPNDLEKKTSYDRNSILYQTINLDNLEKNVKNNNLAYPELNSDIYN